MPDEIIARLRDDLAKLDLPSYMCPLNGLPLMDRAFFPGANGLYLGQCAKSFPVGGVMILGSNFGSLDSYLRGDGTLVRKDETEGPTWKPLLSRLEKAGIKSTDCFFTNAWPMLHRCANRKKSNLGEPQRWLKDRKLTALCASFFLQTVELMQPKLIVAMGTAPASFLSHVWPTFLGLWRGACWRSVNEMPVGVVDWAGKKMMCVVITHPSMSNIHNRKPKYNTIEDEITLLRNTAKIALSE